MLLGKLSEKSKILFFQMEMVLANIDGTYDTAEKSLIESHCKEMGLDSPQCEVNVSLDDIVKNIQRDMSVKERKIILIELLTVAVVDGVYNDKEKELVDSVRKILCIPEEVGNQALDLVKNLLRISREVENFVEW